MALVLLVALALQVVQMSTAVTILLVDLIVQMMFGLLSRVRLTISLSCSFCDWMASRTLLRLVRISFTLRRTRASADLPVRADPDVDPPDLADPDVVPQVRADVRVRTDHVRAAEADIPERADIEIDLPVRADPDVDPHVRDDPCGS
eukprot:6555802-Pyramimonas_sp.AAC.1